MMRWGGMIDGDKSIPDCSVCGVPHVPSCPQPAKD